MALPYTAAREWATEHGHPQPDDRMLNAYGEALLRDAYWKLRQHADAYRNTNGYRRAQERWEQSGGRDDELLHKLSIHVHYARGIEAAAREIAEMLGVPEHEIDEPETTTVLR
ncbi:hypothetical protein [Micromonospora sp. DT47]|uniref:hypothetical protein n=1 Tax=Micromonospora sp. DT47 TaxID=3393431 RepID=UPI003CEB5077